jgi:ectoine hydroxylase-related dioxygenase (phytanoyl-CoA dioxygenase family)
MTDPKKKDITTKMRSAEQDITLIRLTPDELSSKQIGSHNLQAAIEALHRDGIVVLENAVDPAHLDKLNSRMVPEAEVIYAKSTTHRNVGPTTGNIQQEPVLEEGYIFEDIIANPLAVAVVECMLGPNPALRFHSANTAFNATGRQPPHIDVEFDFPRVPFGYCVNINLVGTSPENGATEVWPGTHIDTTNQFLEKDELRIKEDILEARRKVRPPVQPSLPKGSLIIRDFRLWHAGMPNKTEDPRVMIVTVLFPRWYRSNLEIILPESVKGKINWGSVNPVVKWVPDGYDYLKGAHDHDFVLLP